MKSNICLILFGVLIAHVVLSSAENTKDNSLSEVASSRLARDANADPGRNKAKKKNKKTRKVNRKNKKAKKSKKRNNSKKATRRNKKSKKANRRNKKSKKANRKNKKSKKVNKKRRNRNKKSKTKKAKKTKRNREGYKSNMKAKKTKSLKIAVKDIPEICLTEAVSTLYNGLAKKASNFDRQVKRIEKRVPIIANKLAKAGDYIQAANNMANIIPSCPTDLVFAAEELSLELGTCEAKITDSCQPPILYNQTKIDECKIVVEAFKKETEECINLTNDLSPSGSILACGCWESEILKNLYDDLADCNIIEMNKNVTDRFKECKGSVSDCNKAETDSFPVYVNCSNSAQTIDDLEEEAKLLANNINALYQALTAVMKAASLTRRRIIRVATTNCSDYIGLVKKRELFLNKCLNII